MNKKTKQRIISTLTRNAPAVGIIVALLVSFAACTKSLKIAGCVESTLKRLTKQYGEPPEDIKAGILKQLREICKSELE